MVLVFDPIRGDDQILDSDIQAHSDTSCWELRNVCIRAADRDKELPTAGYGDGGIEDAALNNGRRFSPDPPQFGQLNSTITNSKSYFAGKTVPTVMFGFKLRKTNSPPLARATLGGKEVLVGPVHIL